jgi:hypothetical protein
VVALSGWKDWMIFEHSIARRFTRNKNRTI